SLVWRSLSIPPTPRRVQTEPSRVRVPLSPVPDWLSLNPTEPDKDADRRSEEHTSELQSLRHLVCRLLLEKKKKKKKILIVINSNRAVKQTLRSITYALDSHNLV